MECAKIIYIIMQEQTIYNPTYYSRIYGRPKDRY